MTRTALFTSTLAGVLSFVSVAAQADGPFNWAGFYFGANAGVAAGEFSNSLAIVDNTPNNYFFPPAIAAVNTSGSPELRSQKFTGGGQVGYNIQSGALVWGIEVDFNSIHLKKAYGNPLPGANNFVYPTSGAPYQLAESAAATWLFTARPRLGVVMDQRTMLYATGGIAVTRLAFSQFFAEAPFTPSPETAAISKTKIGWSLGGGFELALAQHWTLKGEYVFTHFGAESAVGQLANANGASPVVGFVDGATFNNSVRLEIHTLRTGINYKF